MWYKFTSSHRDYFSFVKQHSIKILQESSLSFGILEFLASDVVISYNLYCDK